MHTAQNSLSMGTFHYALKYCCFFFSFLVRRYHEVIIPNSNYEYDQSCHGHCHFDYGLIKQTLLFKRNRCLPYS